MYIINTYTLAVALCVITMICWGSWANTQKMASKTWTFQLFYWDYVIGIVILSVILGLTFGSIGSQGRSFISDLLQASSASLLSAFIGGIVFNISNILLVAAIDIAGMAVAFPVGVGIALVLGVITNYISVPIGNPFLLFGGVALVVIAIILDAVAYNKLGGQKERKVIVKGLIIAIISGILMGCFYRFVAAAMSLNFEVPAVGQMTPYSATFIFAIGIFSSNFIFNTIVMRWPFKGKPVSYNSYFKGKLSLHSIGIFGGFIWGLGTLLSFLASGKAGYAISYGLGQGATLVAALWGVFIWREFKHADKEIYKLLTLMFICFIIGLSLIIVAK